MLNFFSKRLKAPEFKFVKKPRLLKMPKEPKRASAARIQAWSAKVAETAKENARRINEAISAEKEAQKTHDLMHKPLGHYGIVLAGRKNRVLKHAPKKRKSRKKKR